MARKKQQATNVAVLGERSSAVLEQEAPMLDQVLDNTPQARVKPDIPPGYEILPDGEWFVRVNPEFVAGRSQLYPVVLYRADEEDTHDSIMEYDHEVVQDFYIYGEVAVAAAQAGTSLGCGISLSKGSVRLRIPAGTIIAVKR